MSENKDNKNPDSTPNPLVNNKNGKGTEQREETVTVPKSFMEEMMKTMTAMQDKVKNLEQAQGELEKTSSPDQLRKIEALRASGKLVKNVKFSVIDGKLVKEWQSTADEVYIDNVLGKEVSKQMTKITFFDGKTQDLSQVDFARRKTLKEFEVIREGKDKEGEFIFTIMTEEGDELSINSRFIN